MFKVRQANGLFTLYAICISLSINYLLSGLNAQAIPAGMITVQAGTVKRYRVKARIHFGPFRGTSMSCKPLRGDPAPEGWSLMRSHVCTDAHCVPRQLPV